VRLNVSTSGSSISMLPAQHEKATSPNLGAKPGTNV